LSCGGLIWRSETSPHRELLAIRPKWIWFPSPQTLDLDVMPLPAGGGRGTHREYWIMYRGPGFLALLWFGFSHTPYPPKSPVSMPDRRQAGRLRKRATCWRQRGEGGRGSESYDRKKAWSSINHSILSGGRSTTGRVPGTRAGHGQPNTPGVRVRKNGGCRIGAVSHFFGHMGGVYSKEVHKICCPHRLVPGFFSLTFSEL
jgi:hypothetical protein